MKITIFCDVRQSGICCFHLQGRRAGDGGSRSLQKLLKIGIKMYGGGGEFLSLPSVISGTGAAICTAVVAEGCNGR
jgi:hypothetical protein